MIDGFKGAWTSLRRLAGLLTLDSGLELGSGGPKIIALSDDPRVTPPSPTPAVGTLGIHASGDMYWMAAPATWMPLINQVGEEFGELDLVSGALTPVNSGGPGAAMGAAGRGTFGSSGTAAGNSARLHTTVTPGWSRGKPWNVIAWSRRIHWQITVTMSASTANGRLRFVIGKSATTAGDPTARALGIRVDNLAIKGIVHNGSALDVVDLATSMVINQTAVIDMISLGNGTAAWFVDGVAKPTSSAAPTGDGAAGDARAIFEVENGADAAAVSAALHRARYRFAHT